MMNRFWFSRYDSPVGTILMAGGDQELAALDFEEYRDRMERLLAARFPDYTLAETKDGLAMAARLDRYFEGGSDAFEGLQVSDRGTALQTEVWRRLRTIPMGTTRTYGQLAAEIGRAGAARAVGRANSQNPVAIVAPCHRVIGADGRLTGYAGGLNRKKWLLDHEKRFA